MSVARPPCSRTLQPGSFHRSCTACRGLRASEPAQRATKREAAVLKARWLSACRARARRRPRRSAVGWPTTTPRCARRPSRRRGASWRRRARRPSCAGAWRTRCAARRPSRCPPLTLPCRRAPWHADHQVLINNVDAQGRELRVCLPGALLRQVTSTSVCVCTVTAFHGLRAPGLGHHQAAPARRRWLCCRCRHRRLAAAQSRRPQRRLLSARSRPPRRRRSARPRARPCTCRRAHFSGVSRSHIAAPLLASNHSNVPAAVPPPRLPCNNLRALPCNDLAETSTPATRARVCRGLCTGRVQLLRPPLTWDPPRGRRRMRAAQRARTSASSTMGRGARLAKPQGLVSSPPVPRRAATHRRAAASTRCGDRVRAVTEWVCHEHGIKE